MVRGKLVYLVWVCMLKEVSLVRAVVPGTHVRYNFKMRDAVTRGVRVFRTRGEGQHFMIDGRLLSVRVPTWEGDKRTEGVNGPYVRAPNYLSPSRSILDSAVHISLRWDGRGHQLIIVTTA